MQFANFLRSYLTQHGVRVINTLTDPDIDIILHVNPFPHLTLDASAYSYKEAAKYKKKHPKTIIIERVNECDERKGTTHMNRLLVQASENSDFVVFIASWLRPLLLKSGLSRNKPYRIILNGADEAIFNLKGKASWNSTGKLKIVTHHWSNNLNKGHDIYHALDRLLGNPKFGNLFEFTYIGRTPNLEYTHSKIIPPLSGQELANELKKHHIYLTASKNEPAGMHHIEGAMCGLPLLYLNSGALPEYCENYGIEFTEENFEEKIIELRQRYQEFAEKIKTYGNTAEKMGREFLNLFNELYERRDHFEYKKDKLNWKKLIPPFVKLPLMGFYVLARCVLRGLPSKDIRLNLAGVLPSKGSIVHGGKVKLLLLRDHFQETWWRFNIAYFASSGLPFAPHLWVLIYKLFGIKIVWNQNGIAYEALYPGQPDVVKKVNDLMKPIHESDYVFFQTEFTKRCSDKFLGEFQGNYEILVNPVETKRFIPRVEPLPMEPLTIMMSGHHFESLERLEVSLDSIRELRSRGEEVKLIVVGNTQNLPKEEWIEVVGKFSREEAPHLYHKAHILLHLKNMDPCPNFVLEALSSGLPVVGLNNGGMPELVDPNSGILIPASENFEQFYYPSLIEVAEALLKIKDNLQHYSEHARKQALKFDQEKWLARHTIIFENLCRRSQ